MVTKAELTEALSEQSQLIKKQLDEGIAEIRKEIIDKLTEEIVKLHEKVNKQENKIIDLEKRLEQNLQYQRSSSILLSGVPLDVQHHELEGIVLRIFNNICYHQISERDIVAVHRVSKSSAKILVKFVNKRDAISLLEGKDALNKLDREKMDLGHCDMLYVEEHLTPYISNLAYKCRCLKRSGKILKTNISKILKVGDNGTMMWYEILHTVDILNHFPDFENEGI